MRNLSLIALVLICIALSTSSTALMAQQDQPGTEAKELIDRADSITERGLDSITQEEASEALSLYERALSLDSESFAIWNYESLSRLYEFLGNRARAVEILQQELKAYPYDFMALLSTARVYEEYEMVLVLTRFR